VSALAQKSGHRLAQLDPVGLALRLALLDLLLAPIGRWYIRPLVMGLAAVGLLVPGQMRRPWLWFALAGLSGLRVLLDWQLADNHAYLLAYWCLAVALALLLRDRNLLAVNGRLLIGLVFAFATLWKLLSPDFLDGTFLRVTMVVDDRFEGFARLAGGLEPAQRDVLQDRLLRHQDIVLPATPEMPVPPMRFLRLATFSTWGVLLLEAALALAFLWPLGRGPSRTRDGLLMIFCATTYAVATVEGFGWLLVSMGIAQTTSGRHRTRLLYLATFILIFLYREIPWADLLLKMQAG
jgi:hypothetical protein